MALVDDCAALVAQWESDKAEIDSMVAELEGWLPETIANQVLGVLQNRAQLLEDCIDALNALIE